MCKDFVIPTESFLYTGDKMGDLLYNAALQFEKLKNIKYRIIVGRKGYSYEIILHFPYDSFFHLCGLQHLTDITFPSTNKERLYKEIHEGRLSLADIQHSIYYHKWFIEERMQCVSRIAELIESNAMVYLINNKEYIRYTNIKADFLCVGTVDGETIYLYLVYEYWYRKFDHEYKCCSMFKKHKDDYTRMTSKTTTLLVEKITDSKTEEIYRNPVYHDDDDV